MSQVNPTLDDILTRMASDSSLAGTRFNLLYNRLGQMQSDLSALGGALAPVPGYLFDIITLLETMNNNASANAQNLQTVVLGSACCEPDQPTGFGTVPGKCSLVQDVVDFVFKWAEYLAPYGTRADLPTSATIQRFWRDPLRDPAQTGFMTQSEARRMLDTIRSFGQSNLSAFAGLRTNEALELAVANVLYSTPTAAEMRGALLNFDSIPYGLEHGPWIILVDGFTKRIFDEIYNPDTLFTGAGWNDAACGGAPAGQDWPSIACFGSEQFNGVAPPHQASISRTDVSPNIVDGDTVDLFWFSNTAPGDKTIVIREHGAAGLGAVVATLDIASPGPVSYTWQPGVLSLWGIATEQDPANPSHYVHRWYMCPPGLTPPS